MEQKQIMDHTMNLQRKIDELDMNHQSQQLQLSILKDAKKIMNKIICLQFQYDQKQEGFNNIILTQKQIETNRKIQQYQKRDSFLFQEDQQPKKIKKSQLYQDIEPRYQQPIKKLDISDNNISVQTQNFSRNPSQYDYITSKYIQSSDVYVTKSKNEKSQNEKSQNKKQIMKNSTPIKNNFTYKSDKPKSPIKNNKNNLKNSSIFNNKEKSKTPIQKNIKNKQSSSPINRQSPAFKQIKPLQKQQESFIIQSPIKEPLRKATEDEYISFNQYSNNNLIVQQEEIKTNINEFDVNSINTNLVNQNNILQYLSDDYEMLRYLLKYLTQNDIKSLSQTCRFFYKNSQIQIQLNPQRYLRSTSLLDVSQTTECDYHQICFKLENDELIRRLMQIIYHRFNDKSIDFEQFQDYIISFETKEIANIQNNKQLDILSTIYFILTDNYINIDIDAENYKIQLKSKDYFRDINVVKIFEDFIFTSTFNENQKFLINILLANKDLKQIFNLNNFGIIQQDSYQNIKKQEFDIEAIVTLIIENLIMNKLLDEHQYFNQLNTHLKNYFEIQQKTNEIKQIKSRKFSIEQ